MSELIDREATVKQICKMGEMLGISHDRDVVIAIALFVQDDKSAFPTVERPHGEWIPFEWDSNYKTKIPLPKGSDSHMEEYWDEEFICSVCGKEHHARNFCPNCGADMRKEGESN